MNQKYVNGELVDMTADEIAEIEALRAKPNAAEKPDLTMRQFRLALISAGLDDDVDAALAAMPGTAGKLARAEYEYASTVSRSNSLVSSLAGALGLTDEQINTLWDNAITL